MKSKETFEFEPASKFEVEVRPRDDGGLQVDVKEKIVSEDKNI